MPMQGLCNSSSITGKVYGNAKEEVKRRAIWEANMQKIQHHNLQASLGKHTFTIAMNQFGDLVRFA